ncbi:MAG: hypothetical protein H0W86_03115 [Armatimonadetes bacterium]|nr:hypothetical protein [Armatimonadota bacterium]
MKRKSKWWILGLAIAVGGAVYLNRETWQIYRQQSAAKARNEARMQAVEAERTNLLDKKARLETAIGQEEQARINGYRKPDETPLRLRP